MADATCSVLVVKEPTELWIEAPAGSDVWTLLARRTAAGIEVRREGRIRWAGEPWQPLWQLLVSADEYSEEELDRIWREGAHGRG